MPYSALPWPPGGSSSCTMALPSSMWRGVSPSPSSSCRTTSMHRLQTMFLICSVVVAICCNTGAKLTKISRDSMFPRLFLLPDHRSSSAGKYPPLALAAGAFPRFPAAPRRAFRRCRLRFPYRTLLHLPPVPFSISGRTQPRPVLLYPLRAHLLASAAHCFHPARARYF